MRCTVLGLHAQLWVKAKNCTVSRIKHTSGPECGGGSLHLGPGLGLKPLGKRSCLSWWHRRLQGAADTFLKEEEEEEEEPCWARGTKFTLSCSFKTTAGQGERVDALRLGPGPGQRNAGPVRRRLCSAQGGRQHKGTLPTAGSTTQPERYRGS